MLVLAGTGAIVLNDTTGGGVTQAGVSLTFGLTVTGVIYALGRLSGAHINPAVTLALWAAKKIDGRAVGPYLTAQSTGALAASGLLRLWFAEHPTLGATLPSGEPWLAYGLELGMTWLLMAVIFAAAGRGYAGVVVGAVVGLEAFFGGPISGASMNPARSLGPALVSGRTEHLWGYIVAPILGALMAVPVALFFPSKEKP